MNKFWNFTNQTAESADLNIYNDISDNDYWGDGLITPQQFKNDLKELGDVKTIHLHINSRGGGVFAGHTISNLLRIHPASITAYVDGLAASIASIVAMAADKVIMQPGSMMMIHNPANFMFGSYESGEMREMADVLDKVRDASVSVYQQKCKKTADEIKAIMDAETWYTAEEAVEAGFADEVGSGTIINCAMQGKMLQVGHQSFDLSPFQTIPQLKNSTPNIVLTANQELSTKLSAQRMTNMIADINAINKSIKNEGEIILNIKDLQGKYPELYSEILNLGITQERSRMKAIDDLALPGYEELLQKARYETGISAETVAMQIVAAEKQHGQSFLTNRQADATNGVNGIRGNEQLLDGTEQLNQAALSIAAGANEGRCK